MYQQLMEGTVIELRRGTLMSLSDLLRFLNRISSEDGFIYTGRVIAVGAESAATSEM